MTWFALENGCLTTSRRRERIGYTAIEQIPRQGCSGFAVVNTFVEHIGVGFACRRRNETGRVNCKTQVRQLLAEVYVLPHDRGRALDNRVQELDHFPRLDRARIAVRPIGEFLLKDSFRVFRVLAALVQVPLGEIPDQRRHVVGIPRGRHLDGSSRSRAVHGAARIDPFLQQIAKPLRPGASICERQPWEVAKRDDAGPALVPKPKLPHDSAGAGFPDPQHQAGDGRVRKCTYAALLDRGAREPADKGSGHSEKGSLGTPWVHSVDNMRRYILKQHATRSNALASFVAYLEFSSRHVFVMRCDPGKLIAS
jgi:hypothetical protein